MSEPQQTNHKLDENDPRAQMLKGERPVIKMTYPKFRFWDPTKSKFYFSTTALFGDVNDDLKQEFIAPHVIIVEAHEKKLEVDDLQWISEFTGVLDSTPEMKPIFSGDIVHIPNAQMNGKDEDIIVQWAVPFARWNISPYLVGRREIFITGNIYQNPPPPPPAEPPKFETGGNIASLKKNGKLVN